MSHYRLSAALSVGLLLLAIYNVDVAADCQNDDVAEQGNPNNSASMPGDQNEDGNFNQDDVQMVLDAGKYLSSESATWAEGDFHTIGDWNPLNPNTNRNCMFDEWDKLAAGQTGTYMPDGNPALSDNPNIDGTGISVTYVESSGRLGVRVEDDILRLIAIRIESTDEDFFGVPPAVNINLDGFFDIPFINQKLPGDPDRGRVAFKWDEEGFGDTTELGTGLLFAEAGKSRDELLEELTVHYALFPGRIQGIRTPTSHIGIDTEQVQLIHVPVPAVPAVPAGPLPTAYWDFDGNVDDQSGNGNDGELVDAVYDANFAPPTGGGQSISFENDTDHVFIENADGTLDSSTFTLSMFILDRGQEGALERLTSREGDTFETAINVHPPFNGMGEISYFSSAGGGWKWGEDLIPEPETWTHVAYTADADTQELNIYIDGELAWTEPDSWFTEPTGFMHIGNRHNNVEGFDGLIDDVAMWDEVLSPEQIKLISRAGVNGFLNPDGDTLAAGDADRDLDFDQLDLVQVQIAGKYLTGAAATWGEGDWDGAPGGSADAPPPGDGLFNQLDIIAALNGGLYLTGPYGAVHDNGSERDEQTSIRYDPSTGEVAVEAPAGMELTSINIDSASRIFTGAAAQNLGGSFDNDADNNIFKATFGGMFGTISFGKVAQIGLAKQFVLNDLTVVGSLAGGGDLGNVDLIYVPEPATVFLALCGMIVLVLPCRSHVSH